MTTKLLIDGDVICYRAGFAAEKTKYLLISKDGDAYFDDAKAAKEAAAEQGAVWSRKDVQPVEQAILIADVMIKDIKDRYGSENPSVVTYLSGVGNFRHSIATRATYKGNRSGSVPPVHLKAIRNHLIDRGAIVSVGEEADDLIARAAAENPRSIVCSVDKDLRSIPGRFYDFVKKEEQTISPKEASLNFYSQVLSGDSTDQIPGLPGIGPVKARKILEGASGPYACWLRIVDIYHKEFGEKGLEYALECARLVKIGQPKGVLWAPPAEPSKSASGAMSGKKKAVGSGLAPGAQAVV